MNPHKETTGPFSARISKLSAPTPIGSPKHLVHSQRPNSKAKSIKFYESINVNANVNIIILKFLTESSIYIFFKLFMFV